jgi:hypothetical protein
MRHFSSWVSERAIGLALVWVLAGCSTNAGFGTPVSGPNPVNNQQPYGQPYGVSPTPVVGGSIGPFMRGLGPPPPAPTGSPSPTPTPAPNTLSIVGPSLRLAYDGSAKDPDKAPRLLELSFALENTTQNGAKVTSVVVHAEQTALGQSAVEVTAAPGQISAVTTLVLKTTSDPTQYKELSVTFLDDTKKMIGSTKLDVPTMETDFTSLDEKHPKGPLSIDSVEITSIDAGKTPHYDCTFALTNASGSPVAITAFTIKPPKGDSVTVPLQLPVSARSVSGFISIVVPYSGKALPSGSYSVTAMQNVSAAAKATAVLL